MTQYPHFQQDPRNPPLPRGNGYNAGPSFETVVVQQDPDKSVTSLTVPLLLVASFGTFLVGATYVATSQFAALHHSIDKLGGKIDAIAGSIGNRIDRIEGDQAGNLTKKDHELWCASAERVNRATGWACQEHVTTTRQVAPTVQGWQARLK